MIIHNFISYLFYKLDKLITCNFSQLQYIASPHPYQYFTGHAPSIIHAMPMGESEQTSNAASPDESYQAYQQPPPK